jgi:hypothetical protein
MAQADAVFVNGNMRTMDPRRPHCEALAVRGGEIVAMADTATIRALVGSATRVVDLGGRPVTPGIVDSHSNLAGTGMELAHLVDVRGSVAPRVSDVVGRIRQRAERVSDPRWIQATGWSEAGLAEGRAPTRRELDEAVADRPVVLTHITGHSIVANSAALREAGVRRSVSDPPGGEIVRDAGGDLTGHLKEFPAMRLVTDHIPPWTHEQWAEAVHIGTDAYLREGITATKENYSRAEYEQLVKIYVDRLSQGTANVRSVLQCRAATREDVGWATMRREDLFVSPDPAGLQLGAIKIFIDGSLAARTAWTYDAYLPSGDTPAGTGYPALDQDAFKEMVMAAHGAGFRISVHAIGDRAVDATLDAYEHALARAPRVSHGHSIIHALLLRPQALERIRRADVVVETQPPFITFLGDAYARVIDIERLHRLIPLRSLLDAGITVGGGSDAPICPHALRHGLRAAVRRQSAGGLGDEVFGGEQSITLPEALALYTRSAAECLSLDEYIGSLQIGKGADLVVWNRDPAAAQLDELADLYALMTVVNGQIVYRSSEWQGN